ncbi:hypothetical protein ACN2XU_22800 [Primorskyibacter sp. 2E107]|uniref:hypothetical protein n=1 Tax=Primorskyibacter sp. 2E107 TaxID=3403458 RepID=UPI003AF8CE73
MHHTPTLPAATTVPNWMDVDVARKHLAEKMDAFVLRALNGDATEAAAFRVSPGVGKTSTALRAIADHAEALLERGHVLIYMPTLDLAAQAARDFRELAPHVPYRVIRGRAARNPETDAPMCSALDLVQRLRGAVPSITRAVCRKGTLSGDLREAHCAANCAYLAQHDITEHHVTFLAHTYLTIASPLAKDARVALRVIDEKVWQTMSSIRELSLDRFLAPTPSTFDSQLRATHARVRELIAMALSEGVQIMPRLEREGVKTETLIQLAEAERAATPALQIWPSQPRHGVDRRMSEFDLIGYQSAQFRAEIFDLLAETGGLTGNQLSLHDGEEQMVRIYDCQPLPRNAPLMLLDADADPMIVDRLAPGCAFHSIDVKPQADVVQLSDRTMSDSYLCTGETGAKARQHIRAVIDTEVTRKPGAKVLVVSTSRVRDAFERDRGTAALIAAVDWRCFGPGMQGLNAYAAHDTVIIIGRLQPPLPAVEDQARAVFCHDRDTIAAHTDGALPETVLDRLMTDGRLIPARGRNHPDARAQSLLAQTRECGTQQAIARLRLASPDREKRVIILSKQPLPTFPVTRTTTFDNLIAEISGEPDPTGRATLEPAITAARMAGLASLRLSAKGLTEDLPAAFPSESKAKNFRRGRCSEDVVALVRRICSARGWTAEVSELTPQGGGRPVPTVLFRD